MKKFVAVSGLLASMMLVPSVQADDYFQIQAGRTSTDAFDELCADISDAEAEFGIDGHCSDSDNGYRLAFGLGFSEMFALEIGYQDIASFSAGLSDGGDYEDFTFDVKGYDIAGVVRIALSDSFNLLGRVGILRWDGELSYSSSFGDDDSVSDSGNATLFGVGAEYGILTLNYEVIQDVGNDDIGEEDLERLSLGLKFSF